MVHKREPYWILPGRKLGAYLAPLVASANFNQKRQCGIKGLKKEYLVYQEPKGKGYSHIGRFKEHKKFLPDELRHIMERDEYDLVFLVEGERGETYVLKAFQENNRKLIEDELNASRTMAQKNIGPQLLNGIFEAKIGSHTIYLFAEEYLSPRKGWHPLAEVWKMVKNHGRKFAENFAKLVRRLHLAGYVYHEEFFPHLFIKPLTGELKLIDFGTAYKNAKPGMYDEEVEKCLELLKENFFSEEEQELFIKAYEEDYRQIGENLRTDTVILKGTLYSTSWQKRKQKA